MKLNVGDLIRCGDEFGIVIQRFQSTVIEADGTEFLTSPWLEVLWADGFMTDRVWFDEDDAEVISECG